MLGSDFNVLKNELEIYTERDEDLLLYYQRYKNIKDNILPYTLIFVGLLFGFLLIWNMAGVLHRHITYGKEWKNEIAEVFPGSCL